MPKTLLLADDSLTIQKVVGICLANEDVSIVSVDNGEDAVIKARALKPDLVIADVVMPRKNGYEVCLSIRQDPELKHIPVILLAGAFEAFDEKRYREVMANSYIIKPFESQTLIAAVRKLLYPEQAQVGAPPSTPMRPPMMPPSMVPPASRPPMPEMPMAPPHVASQPPASAVRPPTSPARPMTPPVMPPPAPPPAPAVIPPLAQPVPSFEAALGPAPAPAVEAPRPPSNEMSMSMVDEISAADIEEIAASSVVDAIAPPPSPAPAPAPAGWEGIEIKQPDAAEMEVDHSRVPEPRQGGIEDWGLDLKQELAEGAAPRILTPAESAQEMLASPPAPAPAPVQSAPIAAPIVEMVAESIAAPLPAAVAAAPSGASSPADLQEMVKKSIREIVERVAWEVVPDLAETIIREELKRLLSEEDSK